MNALKYYQSLRIGFDGPIDALNAFEPQETTCAVLRRPTHSRHHASKRVLVAGVLVAGLINAGGCGQSGDAAFEARLRAVLLTTNSDIACGPIEVAPLVPDCPIGSACFTGACEGHNRCYSTCGVSRDECDQQFFEDMNALCDENLTLLDDEFTACRYMALVYWTAVSRFGQGAYDSTQETVCARDDSVRGQPGACCRPGGVGPFCEEVEDDFDCPFFGLFLPGLTCDEVESTFGGCPVAPNDICENAEAICGGQSAEQGLGRCAEGEDVFGVGQVCDVFLQDCADEVACLPVDETAEAFRCHVATDTRLASTDGPQAGGDCAESGVESFQVDVWYEYVAPCSGTMTVQMCQSGLYDSMLALYGTNESGEACPCPEDNASLLICNDDYCGGFGTLSGLILEDVVEGACFTFRVGGWSRDGTEASTQRGRSELEIGMVCGGGAMVDSDAEAAKADRSATAR